MNQNQILVIEGTEGVGKTTLVQKLNAIGYLSKHFDYDKKALDVRQKYLSIYRAASESSDNYVFDRSFMSEDVYGPVMRGGSRLSDSGVLEILSFLNSIQSKIIVMTANDEALQSRVKLRNEEDEFAFEDILKLNRKYQEVARRYSQFCDVVELDTSYLSAEQVFQSVVSKI